MLLATETEGRPKCSQYKCLRWMAKNYRRKDGTYYKYGVCYTHMRIRFKMYPFEDRNRAPISLIYKKGRGKMVKSLSMIFILGWLAFYISNPPLSYALSLYPQPDGNYTIVDGKSSASDITAQTIIDNEKRYHSPYWEKVKSMLENSIKYGKHGGNHGQ